MDTHGLGTTDMHRTMGAMDMHRSANRFHCKSGRLTSDALSV